MFIRSLTLAALLAVTGPLLAADDDSPLARDRGQYRPLVVIARSSVDPDYLSLKKALDEPENHQAFIQRNMVLYTVFDTIGQRDGKNLDPQSTMAVIRDLKLGASAGTKIILVGKDGETKLEHSGSIDPKELFSTIDQLPAAEKDAVKPPPEVEAKPAAKVGKHGKPVKPGKSAKPEEPPQPLDD
jgi:hypothetical protein